MLETPQKRLERMVRTRRCSQPRGHDEAARHVVVGVAACHLYCAGLSLQDGHLTITMGGLGYGGKGAYVGWNGNMPEQGFVLTVT